MTVLFYCQVFIILGAFDCTTKVSYRCSIIALHRSLFHHITTTRGELKMIKSMPRFRFFSEVGMDWFAQRRTGLKLTDYHRNKRPTWIMYDWGVLSWMIGFGWTLNQVAVGVLGRHKSSLGYKYYPLHNDRWMASRITKIRYNPAC